MTAEQFAKQMQTGARAMHEQESRNIMAMAGRDREEAERLRTWILDGGPERIGRAGRQLGERLTEGFARLAAIGRSYRT